MSPRQRCKNFSKALLEKYFSSIVKEAAIIKPETIAENYTEELPFIIEKEYRDFLSQLWNEIKGNDNRSIDDILNKQYTRMCIDDKYQKSIKLAKEDANRITLWEKITKSNHNDVAYFKGLLYDYSCELLINITNDFFEDIK